MVRPATQAPRSCAGRILPAALLRYTLAQRSRRPAVVLGGARLCSAFVSAPKAAQISALIMCPYGWYVPVVELSSWNRVIVTCLFAGGSKVLPHFVCFVFRACRARKTKNDRKK